MAGIIDLNDYTRRLSSRSRAPSAKCVASAQLAAGAHTPRPGRRQSLAGRPAPLDTDQQQPAPLPPASSGRKEETPPAASRKRRKTAPPLAAIARKVRWLAPLASLHQVWWSKRAARQPDAPLLT